MNIYAIRDRMIGYYQKPFIADDDKQVLAALAQTVNAGDKTNAIAQAPHHFELWKIAEIQTTGHGAYTIAEQGDELVASLDSLIRGGVREEPGRSSPKMEESTRQSPRNSG